jgi:predicted MFS family arabinose efflux permease
LSIAWGIGPIVSPYIGGVLASWFGCKALFVGLCIYAGALLFAAYNIEETAKNIVVISTRKYVATYFTILSNTKFLLATLVLAMGLSSGLVFSLVGAQMVKNMLGLGPYAYGKYALIIGGGYLLGNLTNRLLINKIAPNTIIAVGCLLYFICLVAMYFVSRLNMFTETVGVIFFIHFSVGFIFPNMMAACISMYKSLSEFLCKSNFYTLPNLINN